MFKRVKKPEKPASSGQFLKDYSGISPRFLNRRPREKNPLLESGLQTRVGRNVRSFVSRHSGVSENSIRRMINELASEIKLVNAGVKEAKRLYARQTADDILKTRKVPVVFFADPQFPEKTYPAFGCNALCTALAAVFRAKGIPTAFVRLNKDRQTGILGTNEGEKHTVLIFNLGKKQFLADPFEISASERMIELTPETHARFSMLEKKRLLSVGRDSWDLGITGFDKYEHFMQTRFFQAGK